MSNHDDLKAAREQLRKVDWPPWEAAIRLVLDALDAAERERDELVEEHRRVLAEECAPDEMHCSCVPTLRRNLAAARLDVERLDKLERHATVEISLVCTPDDVRLVAINSMYDVCVEGATLRDAIDALDALDATP